MRTTNTPSNSSFSTTSNTSTFASMERALVFFISSLLVYLGGCGSGVGGNNHTEEPSSFDSASFPDESTAQVPDRPTPDTDQDGFPDTSDQCSGTPLDEIPDSKGCGPSQRDSDGDGFADGDEVYFIPGTDPFDPTDNPNNVRDSDGDGCSDFDEMNFVGFCDNDPNSPLPDADGDGVEDSVDNCFLFQNSDQADSDGDGVGDACELFFDFDGDGVEDSVDNCILSPNPDQADTDGDGLGDACELFFDFDGDGVEDLVDNCILSPNLDQADSDGDGVGDACDNTLPPPIFVEAVIVADDEQFLGVINDNSFDSDSIANSFGTYGSPFSSLSIWNEFGTYGSEFSQLSPWNDFTSSPPLIFEGDVFIAYLTTNTFQTPRIDPNDLAILVGRSEETRP